MVYGPLPPIFAPKSAEASTLFQNYGSTANVSSPDFMKLLIAQMSSPDLGSLFKTPGEEETESPFGTFGTTSTFPTLAELTGQTSFGNASAATFGQTSLLSGMTPVYEMATLSYLIGKTVTGYDTVSGEKVTGKVVSLSILNNRVVINLENGEIVYPDTITKVE